MSTNFLRRGAGVRAFERQNALGPWTLPCRWQGLPLLTTEGRHPKVPACPQGAPVPGDGRTGSSVGTEGGGAPDLPLRSYLRCF